MDNIVSCLCTYKLYNNTFEPQEYVIYPNKDCRIHSKSIEWLQSRISDESYSKRISGEFLCLIDYERLFKKEKA
jgi:hypothetical protein